MRTATALLFIVPVLTLTACSADAPTTVRLAPTQSEAVNTPLPSRPIHGRCALTILSTTPYPAPPVFRQVAEGTCELSHLGRTKVHFIQAVNFGNGTQHSLALSYTAANGDVLQAASAGTSVPNATGVSFTSTITFLGGTGRFANAAGSANVEGSANIAQGTSQYTLDGSISYNASARGQ
jgi:hypothetical protein